MAKAINAVIGVVLIAADIAFAHTGWLTKIGAAMLLGAAAQALGPKPPHAPPLGGIGVNYSGTLEPRRILYGQLKVGGMHAAPPLTSGNNNDYLHEVLVLAGHPVNAITDIYFDQIRIPSANIGAVSGTSNDGVISGIPDPPSGQVNGKVYNSKAWIRRYLGTQSTADYILTNTFTVWDANHKGQDVAYIAVQFKHDQDAFSGGSPQVTALLQGKKVYDPRLDSTNGGSGTQRYTDASTWAYSTNPALCLRDYLTSSLGLGESNARIDDTLVSAAANKCDEDVLVPIPVLIGLCNWTNGSSAVNGDHTLFKAVLSVGNYVKGPNGTMYLVSAVDSDVQFHISVNYPGTTAPAQVTQYNNLNITWTSQKRYTCNTALDATTRFEDNIATLASAMMGYCPYSGGKWRMVAGGWSGSAFTLTESDLVGGLTIQCTTPRKDLYNTVRGNFIDPQQNYQPAEFPALMNAAYVTEDGGEVMYLETNFPCCNTSYEAQRNGFVYSRQSRNRRVITAQFGMSAFGVKVWETGTVTIGELGWNAQTVRCTSWKFLPQGVIELTLQEAYSADWADPQISDYVTTGVSVAPIPQHYLPYPPTNLVATSIPGAIEFTVTLPDQFVPGSLIDLYEYTAATPFGSATLIATGVTNKFTIAKADQVTRYYWVRTRSNSSSFTSNIYPATNGLAAAASPPSAATWTLLGTNPVNLEGGVATKIGGSGAWDAGAMSLNAYATCHVRGKFTNASESAMIGLAVNPTASYLNLDYALYDMAGSYRWQEGASGGVLSGSVSATDVCAVIYDGSTISYLVNGNSLRTVSVAGLTLHGVVLLYSSNATVDSLDYGPTADLSVTDTGGLGADAATDVYTATVAGPVSQTSPGGWNTAFINSGLVIPGVQDDQHKIVVTGTVEASSNQAVDYGADAQISLLIVSGVGQFSTNHQGPWSSVSTSRKPMTVQFVYSPVSQVQTTVYVEVGANNSKTVTVWEVNLTAEIIKR